MSGELLTSLTTTLPAKLSSCLLVTASGLSPSERDGSSPRAAFGDDRRSFSYYKAISIIENLSFKVTSSEQLKGLPSIGKSLLDVVSAAAGFKTTDLQNRDEHNRLSGHSGGCLGGRGASCIHTLSDRRVQRGVIRARPECV
jgi:hypothetical protein